MVITFEKFFLEFSFGNLDLDGFVHVLRMTAPMVCVILDGGREEGIDEGRFPKA